jgi:hypothetical protein
MHEALTSCAASQVVKDNEIGALVEGLSGKYVEPGPGGDPIRNPGVLPTGKNIHALDPQSIPTQVCSSPTSHLHQFECVWHVSHMFLTPHELCSSKLM